MVLGVRDRVRELVSPLANHAYRRVWGARLLSEFGDWAARLALSLLVLERTGSAGLTGAIVGMTFLPWLGLGQYLATFGDRFDRRTVMVVADGARAATHVVIALIDGPIWIYFPLAFIASAFDAPFQSSRSAVLVNLTGEDEYPNALRLETITAQTGTVAGLLAGGGFSAVFGPQGALAANAITFLVSALILVGLPKIETETRSRPSIGAGLAVLRNDPLVRRALFVVVAVTIPATTIETQLPVYAKQIAGLGPWAIGGLAVAVPIGTIVATLAVRANADDIELLKRGAIIGSHLGSCDRAGVRAVDGRCSNADRLLLHRRGLRLHRANECRGRAPHPQRGSLIRIRFSPGGNPGRIRARLSRGWHRCRAARGSTGPGVVRRHHSRVCHVGLLCGSRAWRL